MTSNSEGIQQNTVVEQTEHNYPESSHNMVGDYVALMETSGRECESWYYFIRREGNEEALQHLQTQLEKCEWYILDDLSTFDLDLEHFVDAKTAKQMTKLELNSYAFHRKFDGKLKTIDFNFKKKDLRSTERMMERVFDILGYGMIEDYISDEDLDPEDFTDHKSSDDEDKYTDDETETLSETSKETTKKAVLPPLLAKATKHK